MSNRFPADDEHLHKYPNNLKHHKVDKERQRKLLCEMMKDDAKSGLYNERKREPLLSDDEIERYSMMYTIPIRYEIARALKHAKAIYESARVKDAELIQQLFDALYAEQFVPSLGPSPLTKPAIAAASAAGFKPTDQ
ncbi:MAG: hypothetical protein ACK52I_00755 [Pseudomonadota bacterium]|jgi:hypothetical protein